MLQVNSVKVLTETEIKVGLFVGASRLVTGRRVSAGGGGGGQAEMLGGHVPPETADT